jgi:sugar phosphate permease
MGGTSAVFVATIAEVSNNALLAATPFIGLFSVGIYSAVGPTLTEMFPTSLRGSGVGFCYNVGRGLAGITPLAVGSTVAALGYAQSIGFSVIISYIILLFTAVLLKETSGIELARV